jgi:RimJ/RimL family protein N-acetyltransferase
VRHAVSLRLARCDEDIDFLSSLARGPFVEPFLAPGRGDPEFLRELLADADGGQPYGMHVVHSAAGLRLGGLALRPANRRSLICEISTVMVHPDVRRSRVALQAVRLACELAFVEHGLHRVQAEVYGDNIAGQRLFERSGFTREGTRRGAYRRRGQWLDGVLYGLLAEELAH